MVDLIDGIVARTLKCRGGVPNSPNAPNPLPSQTTSLELLRVNTALDQIWIRNDGSKLCPAVVDHEVCVHCRIKRGYMECHGTWTVRIHCIRAFNRHRGG